MAVLLWLIRQFCGYANDMATIEDMPMKARIDMKNVSRCRPFTNRRVASLCIDTSPFEVEIPFSETVSNESGSYTMHPCRRQLRQIRRGVYRRGNKPGSRFRHGTS